jgi:hypothetical protein
VPERLKRWGYSYLAVCAALALHLTDEALTGFLDVYNPTVLAIRERLPWLPIPVFTFRVWLTGLILAVLGFFSFAPLVFAARRGMRFLTYPLGVLMTANALQHVAGSFYLGRPMPGVYSSPLLLAASVWLLAETRKEKRRTKNE